MKAHLSTNRGFIDHPGTKGDSLENVWIEWLRTYLPGRYCIDKAIVIDSEGSLSHQIDLVIYDQHHTPFVFNQNGIKYIPAEGVYAVFEVKPDLKGNIQYAGEKIESVRKLRRTSTNIIDRGRKHDPRPLTKIIGGVLASTSSYVGTKSVEKNIKKLTGIQSIDLGCCVDSFGFFVDYSGEEDFQVDNANERITKYYDYRTPTRVDFSNPENSLITFFLQLSRYLQQSIGTVAAIDFQAYAKNFGITIDERI